MKITPEDVEEIRKEFINLMADYTIGKMESNSFRKAKERIVLLDIHISNMGDEKSSLDYQIIQLAYQYYRVLYCSITY